MKNHHGLLGRSALGLHPEIAEDLSAQVLKWETARKWEEPLGRSGALVPWGWLAR